MTQMQTVLTIAGFDPSSGAGVTADLMVFAAHGLFGTSCITGLTVQSTVGVRSTTAVSAEVVKATLDCLVSDLPPAGIKIGMLTTAENVGVVAEFLAAFRDEERRVPVVLDPVLRSSSGRELLDAEGVAAIFAGTWTVAITGRWSDASRSCGRLRITSHDFSCAVFGAGRKP